MTGTPVYRNDDGTFNDDRMRNAWYWAAQVSGWMVDGPNAGLGGTYYVTVLAGRPVIVADAADWGDSHARAIRDALREDGFPPSITTRDLGEEIRLFIDPNSDRLTSNYTDAWRDWKTQDDFADTEPNPQPHP